MDKTFKNFHYPHFTQIFAISQLKATLRIAMSHGVYL